MANPRALRTGEQVAVVAMASPFGRGAFGRGVGAACAVGLDPCWGDGMIPRDGHLSGGGAARAPARFERAVDCEERS